MSVIGSNVLAGASGQAGAAPAGYAIERSLRFNGSSDSSYLNRTPSSAGNRRTWTWSGWVKRAKISGDNQPFLTANSSTGNSFFMGWHGFYNDGREDAIEFNNIAGTGDGYITTAVFRDPSAWYHVVIAFDSTQSSSGDRIKCYVNGVQQTWQQTSNGPGLNDQWKVNDTIAHTIGDTANSFTGQGKLDSYLADVHFIDGQALAPTDFGEYDDNGVWQPKAYVGSYGTNGFHLDFSDNSSAAALGTDQSTNNNNWTVNNIAVSSVIYGRLAASGSDAPSSSIGSLTYANGSTHILNPSSTNGEGDFQNTRVIGFQNITGVTSLRVLRVSGPNAYLGFNGSLNFVGSFGSLSFPATINQAAWYTVSNPPSTLTSMAFSGGTSGPSNQHQIYRIEVNGVVLYDVTPSDFDSLFDSPTNGTQTDTGLGGEVSGNYCTLNPLNKSTGTLSNGNLDYSISAVGSCRGSMMVSSGKWYFEVNLTASGNPYVGIAGVGQAVSGGAGYVAPNAIAANNGGSIYYRYGGSTTYPGNTVSIGTGVIGIAIDVDSKKIWWSKNGTWYKFDASTANLTTTISEVEAGNFSTSFSNLEGDFFTVHLGNSTTNNTTFEFNAGQRAFAYTAPSGFKALNTANLSDPTIADGSTAMDVVTYTGNGSTQTISGLNLSPDLVWLKRRDTAQDHNLYDSVRGSSGGYIKQLLSNTTSSESPYGDGVYGGVTSLTADGFSLGSSNADYRLTNASSSPYVGWTWDAGHPATATTGAVSFDGSNDELTFSLATGGFGSGDFTLEYFFYQNTLTNYQSHFSTTRNSNGFNVGTQAAGNLVWYDHDTTASVKIDAGSGAVSTGRWYHCAWVRNGTTITGYLDGVSFGTTTSSYDFSATGTAIGNLVGGVEYTNGHISNLRVVIGTAVYTSNFTPPTVELTNVTDTKLLCCQSTTSATAAAVAPGTITANGGASATTFNPLDKFSVNGTGYATTSAAGITEGTIPLTGASVNRSAGFSIVSYTGTGAAGTVGHGLNAAPKIVIFKNRDAATNWRVYTTMVDGSMDSLFLNTTAAKTDSSLSAFTSSVFYCGTNPDHNGSGQAMVAYCFAPVEGYSAFGSYTGNGSADGPFVYTGFRPRWILFKNSSSVQPWNIFDTARDTYNVVENGLLANSSNAEYSGTDRCDILSNGFKLKAGSGAEPNQSGHTYIYAAFAENPFKYARAR